MPEINNKTWPVPDSDSDDSGMTTLAIILISVGCVLILVISIATIFYCRRKSAADEIVYATKKTPVGEHPITADLGNSEIAA